MRYKFSYKLEDEVDYVEELLGDYDWFIENGYDPNLPEGIDKKSNKKDIRKVIKKDFLLNKKIFIQKIENIKKQLESKEKRLNDFFKAFEYNVPKEVDVHFSFFGVGGSYYIPNKMVVLGSLKPIFIFENIIHETVHLIIEEPLIQKYNIPHWQKEMLVDILCESSLLGKIYGKNQIQNNCENIPMEYIEKLKFNRKDTLDYKKFLREI